jgi:hypothetical protein
MLSTDPVDLWHKKNALLEKEGAGEVSHLGLGRPSSVNNLPVRAPNRREHPLPNLTDDYL